MDLAEIGKMILMLVVLYAGFKLMLFIAGNAVALVLWLVIETAKLPFKLVSWLFSLITYPFRSIRYNANQKELEKEVAEYIRNPDNWKKIKDYQDDEFLYDDDVNMNQRKLIKQASEYIRNPDNWKKIKDDEDDEYLYDDDIQEMIQQGKYDDRICFYNYTNPQNITVYYAGLQVTGIKSYDELDDILVQMGIDCAYGINDK